MKEREAFNGPLTFLVQDMRIDCEENKDPASVSLIFLAQSLIYLFKVKKNQTPDYSSMISKVFKRLSTSPIHGLKTLLLPSN